MDSIKPLLLGTREYAIPLPMHARIAKQYEQTLIDYETDIEAFIRAVDPLDNDLIVKMDMLVDRLNNLIKAPDLHQHIGRRRPKCVADNSCRLGREL